MNAITCHQPWATLIALGYKTIETRTHDRFRGLVGERIAIHAGKKWDADGRRHAVRHLYRRGLGAYSVCELDDQAQEDMGKVVCTAVVKEARWLGRDDSDAALCDAAGLFGLVLTDVVRLNPAVPATGRQGIWKWEPPKGEAQCP